MVRWRIESLKYVTYVESSGKNMYLMVKLQSNTTTRFHVMEKRNIPVLVVALRIDR